MSCAPLPQPTPIAVKNLLVVNADPEIENLLREVLAPGLWAFHHATDNLMALVLAAQKSFDLILTSAETSAKEDVELLRRIRRARPHTRLIILASESTPANVIASMRERAFSYFSNPFSLDALRDMIRIATEGPCWDDGIEIMSATPEWIRLQARCDIKTADRLVQFLNEVGELPDPERQQVGAAFREMLLNAIEHGGGLDPNNYVEIDYIRARRMITCRIKDPGPGFSLADIPHAAIANPAGDPIRHLSVREERGLRPGGFGVLLARQMLDQVIYGQHGNEVLLIKYLRSAEPISA